MSMLAPDIGIRDIVKTWWPSPHTACGGKKAASSTSAVFTPIFGVDIWTSRQHQLWTERSNLGRQRGVGFLEQQPDLGPDSLPERELRRSELLVEPELDHDLLLGRLVAVQVQSVEDLQRLARVTMARVRHPTARLHLHKNERRDTQSSAIQYNTIQYNTRNQYASPPRGNAIPAGPFAQKGYTP